MMKLYDEKIFKKYADAFEALAEYDRTGKLPKLSYKKRVDITIDAKLLRQLKEYCIKHGFKLSQLIERHMREELVKASA
ncbi:MAG: hypothetical protein NTY99_00475 [DPANN group archaeon]|nr:hypothetical protein [DPANN group archaeon]